MRNTLYIAAISMASDILIPLLVIRRKTIDQGVWKDGWTKLPSPIE
jgi:hypothetical protein